MGLRFAIIGCGRIGSRHAEQISRVGSLVAACDTDSERADKMVSLHGGKAYRSHVEMLDDVKSDVVAVCSPNGLHARHSIDSLVAGCHVLCEKPMALSSVDCGEMIKAAERANRRLFVVKQNRFNPPVSKVKELIEAGALGKILSVHVAGYWNRGEAYYANDPWKGTLELDGGMVFTQFSHFIDLAYWLVGDVKEVVAFRRNFIHEGVIEFEDVAVASLLFRSGALGTFQFTVNAFGSNMEGSITLFCEKGTVKIGGQYLNELEYHRIADIEIADLPQGAAPNQYGHYVGSMSNHNQVYDNIVSVLGGQGVISANGFEGLKTVEIIERLYESANRPGAGL
ncbi:MAG: UDP-N-acetyl-2-amino-2-deoxyglucuronate dehydrogenase [Rhodothermales bacterium]|jgi:UDP-N-acetyl-2-amino-2-deoxyglucuronate dehydrogenase